jgi:hypothetical protein
VQLVAEMKISAVERADYSSSFLSSRSNALDTTILPCCGRLRVYEGAQRQPVKTGLPFPTLLGLRFFLSYPLVRIKPRSVTRLYESFRLGSEPNLEHRHSIYRFEGKFNKKFSSCI